MAQTDFCLPGATWVYYNPPSGTSREMEDVVTYVGDTVIAPQQEVKILKTHRRIQFSPPGSQTIPIVHEVSNTYVAQSSDSIFELVDGNWEFLFDFDVEIGESNLVFISGDACMAHDTMRIESIDTIQLFGINLIRSSYEILIEDQIYQTPFSTWGTLEGNYLERIGFPYDSPTGGGKVYCSLAQAETFPVELTCYTDDELLGNGGQPCFTVLSTSSELNQRKTEIRLLNQEQLQIQNASNSTLRVYDILGKELFQTALRSDNETIEASHLPNGILIVSVETEARRVTQKVVKTSD